MTCTVGIFKQTGLDHFNRWQDLPDSLFLHVFAFLAPKEVLLASRVCKKWYRNAKDELLWKGLFVEYFTGTSSWNKCSQLVPPLTSSWLLEFQRLYSQTPAIESQVLEEHQDEVLHVAFSHNGRLFASSSKDCQAIVWDISSGEARVKLKLDFREHRWEYVQFCEFAKDDSLLLVSGINERRRLNFMGEIIICAIDGEDDGNIVQNVISEPYDVFGAWLTGTHYISGSFEFRVPFYDSSISELWANSIYGGIPIRLCRVMNENGSSVRNVLVGKPRFLDDNELYLIFTHGIVTYIPHQIVIKKITLCQSASKEIKVLPDSDDIPGANQEAKRSDSDFEEDDEDVGFTKLDHVIETHAHIIGVGLSPEEDLLYVNCRPWVNRGKEEVTPARMHLNGHEDLEISDSIHTRVYSLSTMKFVKEHVGHKAFTPNDRCFFIFLDVANLLVA
ncbi:hypothetical protein QZH41_019621, partial [Actinostola sp. cb2023]